MQLIRDIAFAYTDKEIKRFKSMGLRTEHSPSGELCCPIQLRHLAERQTRLRLVSEHALVNAQVLADAIGKSVRYVQQKMTDGKLAYSYDQKGHRISSVRLHNQMIRNDRETTIRATSPSNNRREAS